jgi:suppressor for copper-sensitivity B
MIPRIAVPSLLAALTAIAGPLAPPAAARDGIGPWVEADEAEIRLVSATSAVAPGAVSLSLALDMKLAEGWRIYWRTPGASGFPPQLDWSGSANLAAAVLHWPVPARFTLYGQESYGYTGRVRFPLTVRLERPGEGAALRLALAYLVCREVCIPGEAALALDLAAGPAEETPAAAAIAAARAALPRPAAEAGVSLHAVAVPGGLSVIAERAGGFSAPDLFLEWQTAPGQRRPDLPRPQVTVADGGREARFDLTLHPPLVRPGTVLTVTLTDATGAVEAAVVVQPPR